MRSNTKTVVSVLLYCFATFLALICTIPAYIKHRLILWIYGQPGDKLVRSLDALFLTEAGKPIYIYWMVQVEGAINIKQLQNNVLERSREHPDRLMKFSSIPVLEHGSLLWRKDKYFKIENHIQEHTELVIDDSHMKEIVQQYLNLAHSEKPFTQSSPISPWRIQLIHTKEGNSLLLFIIGHSLTDGVGCMNLFNNLLTDKPSDIPQPKAWKTSGLLTKIGQCAINFLGTIKHLDTKKSEFMSRTENFAEPKISTAWSKPVSISRLNHIRKKLDTATINDIVCGVFWQALDQYTTQKDVQSQNSVIFGLVASVRQNQTDIDPVNQVGLLQLSLPLHDNKTIHDRITQISSEMSERKQYEPIFSNHLHRALTYSLSIGSMDLLSTTYKNAVGGNGVLCSNIAGPQHTVQITGKDVTKIVFIPSTRIDAGLSFGISSYNGELRVAMFDGIGVVDTQLFVDMVDNVFEKFITEADSYHYQM